MKSMQDVFDQVPIPREENRENAIPAGSNAPSTEILPSTSAGSIHSYVSKSSLYGSSESSSKPRSFKSYKASPSLSPRRRARLLPKAHKLGGKNRPIVVCDSSSRETRAPGKRPIEKNDSEHPQRNGSKDTTLEVSSPQSEPMKALSELRRLQIRILQNLSNRELGKRKGRYSSRSKKSKPLCASGGLDASGSVDILPANEATSETELPESHTAADADVAKILFGFENETAKSQKSSKHTGVENGKGSKSANPSRYTADSYPHAIKRASISNAFLFLAPAVNLPPSQANNEAQGKTVSSCSPLHSDLSSGGLNYHVYKFSAYQRIRPSAPSIRHEDLRDNPRITEKGIDLIEAETKGGQTRPADDKIDPLREKYIRLRCGKLARFNGPAVYDLGLISYSRPYCCHSYAILPPGYNITSEPGFVICRAVKGGEVKKQEVRETPPHRPETAGDFTSGDGINNAHLGSAEDRLTNHDIRNRRRQAKYLRGGLGGHGVEEFKVAAVLAEQTVIPRTWAKAGQLEAQSTGQLAKTSLTLELVVSLFNPIATASKLLDILLCPLKLV